MYEADRRGSKLKDSSFAWYSPGKAANAGGVACSGLEMQQNAHFTQWTRETVDNKLKEIMAECFKQCYETAMTLSNDKDLAPSLVDGANMAGFLRVAEAMRDQGDVW